MHPYRLAAALSAVLLGSSPLAAGLNGAGSTFAEPLYKKWAEAYQTQTVSYEGVGSGEGVARVVARKVDFGGSDEPLKRKELEEKGLRQFPVAMGGIVPVVNLPNMPAGELRLTPDVLARIYLGKIKRWRDNDILNLNGDLAARIPDLPIKPIYRSDASGSTFVFSYYLAALSADWRNGPAVAKELKGVAGIGAKGTGGVVDALRQLPGGIGYVDYGRARKDKLQLVQLPNRVGVYVQATPESIQAAAKFDAEKLLYSDDPDFYLVLANSDTYAGWPLATATFAMVPKAGKEAQKVLDFLYWGYKNGDTAARELGYVPLSESMKVGVRKAWSRQYGFKMGL